MRRTILRPEAPVCQLCSFIGGNPALRPRSLRIATAAKAARQFSSSQRAFANKQSPTPNSSHVKSKPAVAAQYDGAKLSGAPNERPSGGNGLAQAVSLRDTIVTKEGTPSADEVIAVLTAYESIANEIVNPHVPQAQKKDGSATSALLSEITKASKAAKPQQKLAKESEQSAKQLSELALSILEHPAVFITPEMLDKFVQVHEILGQPEALPTAFHLYANKPQPVEGSSPLQFKNSNPDKSANAIEKAVADRALQVAIDAKQLVVAMDIVDTTYNTTAYRRAKFIKKALIPTTGVALAPVAAYVLASKLAMYQQTMDSAVATNIAFVGLCGYITFTTVVGVVAVTTANDQMERVTWVMGRPLRERWIREDERAACDKMALAWGFKEIWKRGEEEGEEWDMLKEWIAQRGMILDKTELMEGME